MEEQIITVHVPKDQYRKFAKLAGQVNVPMQTILSQFVLDCVSDRWGTAEETMAKDWFANHWWSAFERADFFGWLAQSNQLDEILEAQQKLESCKKEITSLEKGLETGYIEAGGVFYSWKTVISADLTPRYKTRSEWESDQKERIREQKVIKAEQERVILDFWNRYQNFRKTEYQKDDVESEESESLKKELKKLRQWRKQVHWD